MANQIRIKRRAAGGAVGAPSSLLNGELAYNESDDILYYGFGAGTGGTATAIKSIAGVGAYIDKVTDQTIGGNKTFSNLITGSVSGNAGTSTKWQTARNLSLTGDASATLMGVDGSSNVSASLTLANTAVTAGSYGSASNVPVFAVDAKGRITSATSTAISIAFAQLTGTPTTLAGYGITDAIPASQKGVANGVATLGADGFIPASQLPSYVDDVVEFASLSAFPAMGETGKIYVAKDTNKTYRWSGSVYIYITSGAVDSVAGKTGVVTLTSADVGLGNVPNVDATNASNITSGTLDAARLATSGVTAGSYGTASQVAQITFDAKGRATSAMNVDIVIDCGTF